LKTKNGISKTFYAHSEETPVYGIGQGTRDSPSQWSQESALLLDLSEREAPTSKMTTTNRQAIVNVPITAFADDTNLLGNDNQCNKSISALVAEAKQAFKLWNKLLHATGHFMELGKCACYLSIWNFQDDGYAFTIPQINIKVTDIEAKKQTIQQLNPDKSQKLLGVMQNPIGNQQDEVTRLQLKSDAIAMKLNALALSHTEAHMAYQSFYLPAMRYLISITSINQMDLKKIQAKATASILAASRFNRNMPREVVFASKIHQGLGMKHLYNIQGCNSTRLLLQEICDKTSTTSQMLAILIDTIQLMAGIGSPILEDTQRLS
jgi:hypothetical protein